MLLFFAGKSDLRRIFFPFPRKRSGKAKKRAAKEKMGQTLVIVVKKVYNIQNFVLFDFSSKGRQQRGKPRRCDEKKP